MNISQNIGKNTGKAVIKVGRQKVKRETAADISPPAAGEKLGGYLDRHGIDPSLLRDLLRMFAAALREDQGGQQLNLTHIEDIMASLQRDDVLAAVEMFTAITEEK